MEEAEAIVTKILIIILIIKIIDENILSSDLSLKLSYLSISQGTLTPEFNSYTNTYLVQVDNNLSSINIVFSTEDDSSQVNVKVNNNLVNGSSAAIQLEDSVNGVSIDICDINDSTNHKMYSLIIEKQRKETSRPVSVWDGTFDNSWLSSDKGDDIAYINSAAEFADMTTYIVPENKTVKLNIDIDLNNLPWYPNSYAFDGTFDGQGHTISNLKITEVKNVYGSYLAGLFARNDGIIRNLNIYSADVVCTPQLLGKSTVGILVGSKMGGIVENCTVHGNVKGLTNVGGLIGISWEGCKVRNCTSSGTVTGGSYAGGIVGYTIDGNQERSEIYNCISRSNINGGGRTGGIVGVNSGKVVNCAATGHIDSGIYTGGIAGEPYGWIDGCLFAGTINGRSGDRVGGIAGFVTGSLWITNCTVSGQLDGGDSTGGIIGYVWLKNSFKVTDCDVLGKISGGNAAGCISYINLYVSFMNRTIRLENNTFDKELTGVEYGIGYDPRENPAGPHNKGAVPR